MQSKDGTIGANDLRSNECGMESGGDHNFSRHEQETLDSPSSASTMSSKASFPSLKLTVAFIHAYKAMRGPRDTMPSSLSACRGAILVQKAVDFAEQAEDGESGLANLEVFRFSHSSWRYSLYR